MSKDKPARNPRLSPAGLPPEESARHQHVRRASAPESPVEETCRFICSEGGTSHCGKGPYLSGFCRFHHHCLVNGEISPLGKILDTVKDQARRREINSYGQALIHRERLEDDPLTGMNRG
ncbi:MAG: hypothetical protein E2P04_07475 [Acidobacteria bacterium]|nr:MAG: hypothetical protein E2P04_07475 [Acidobacteriota bacterium]